MSDGTTLSALVRAAARQRPEAPAVVAGDRRLILHHRALNRVLLDERDARLTLQHLADLWGYDVVMREVDPAAADGVDMAQANDVLDGAQLLELPHRESGGPRHRRCDGSIGRARPRDDCLAACNIVIFATNNQNALAQPERFFQWFVLRRWNDQCGFRAC